MYKIKWAALIQPTRSRMDFGKDFAKIHREKTMSGPNVIAFRKRQTTYGLFVLIDDQNLGCHENKFKGSMLHPLGIDLHAPRMARSDWQSGPSESHYTAPQPQMGNIKQWQ